MMHTTANQRGGAMAAILAICLSASGAPAGAEAGAPTFARDVAPILFAHCAGCHRPGQIAPMSLIGYEEIRPWAKSIRKTVVEREMPPWDADPAHGNWSNNIALGEDQIKTISAWVDAGAPMGDPAELPEPPKFSEGWTIGEPDLVIDLPETKVPAEGADLFPDHVLEIDVPPGVWLNALEVLPGNREVLHHVIAFLGEAAMRANEGGESRPATLRSGDVAVGAIWAAGTPPTVHRAGMGHPLKAKQTFTFNMHYHPSGSEASDRTRIGLHFGKGELRKRLKTMAAINVGLLIEPGAENRELRVSYRFGHDTEIVSFFPHMHLRGRSFEYVLHRPDGTRETMLRVPKYDFNWQWVYYPEQPIKVRAGSRIEAIGHFDNSAANPANPNPGARLGFGEETDDEMLIGFVEAAPAEGVDFPPENPSIAVSDFLQSTGATDSWIAGFGPLIPAAAGFHLPKTGDGAMHMWASATIGSAPIRDIRWNGGEVAGKLILFGNIHDFKGIPGEKGGLNIEIVEPPDAEPIDPQFQFIVRMLANLKAEPMKPALQLGAGN